MSHTRRTLFHTGKDRIINEQNSRNLWRDGSCGRIGGFFGSGKKQVASTGSLFCCEGGNVLAASSCSSFLCAPARRRVWTENLYLGRGPLAFRVSKRRLFVLTFTEVGLGPSSNRSFIWSFFGRISPFGATLPHPGLLFFFVPFCPSKVFLYYQVSCVRTPTFGDYNRNHNVFWL